MSVTCVDYDATDNDDIKDINYLMKKITANENISTY